MLPRSYGANVHCFVSITERHRPSGEWERLWGEALPAFTQLVVCEVPGAPGVLLLGLDANGHVRFDSQHEAIADAKRYAESEFQGISAEWQVPSASNAAGV